jgi:integral membrane protein
MAVIAAEWRKLGLPGIWLVAALTVAGSWGLTALMSRSDSPEQALHTVPGFAVLGFILLGVMAATGEYAGRQIATTCTAMPRRLPVLAAKLLTVTATLAIAATPAAGGMRLLVPDVECSVPGVVTHFVAMGLMGYAAALVLRQLVPALTTALVLLVLAGPVLQPLTRLVDWLPGSVGADLFAPSPAHPVAESAGALAGWVLGFWLIAGLVWVRRDA